MEGCTATLLSHKRSQLPEWGPPFGDQWSERAVDEATVSPQQHSNLTCGHVRLGSLTFIPYPNFGFGRRQETNLVSPEFSSESENCEQASLEHELSTPFDTATTEDHSTPSDRACEELLDDAVSEPPASAIAPNAPSTASDAGSSQPTALTAQLRLHLSNLQRLSKRAAFGDETAVAEIQSILNDNQELWRHLGDVEHSTEAMLIEYLSGPAATKESVRRSVAELKHSLAGDNPSQLERLAVGRVVACWLFTQFIERWCGHAVKEIGRTAGLGTLLEASEKRLQTAIQSLKLARTIR